MSKRDPVERDRELVLTEIAAANYEPKTPAGRRYPNSLPQILTEEQSALRRLSPRRSRWPELARFDEQVGEIEGHIRELSEQSQRVNEQLMTVEREDADSHAAWLLAGSEGDQPAPQKPLLEAQQEQLQQKIAGARAAVDQVLKARADHVERHRPRLIKDVDAAAVDAKNRYEEALATAEQARQELAELRESAIWARLYPSCNESDVQLPNTVAGGQRKRLVPAGLTAELKPANAFALLRSDAEWLNEAIPHSQLAREKLLGEDKTGEAV
jgi:hypothetical protein